jgi:hypothetical protein
LFAPQVTRFETRSLPLGPALRRLFWVGILAIHLGAIPSLITKFLLGDGGTLADAAFRGVGLLLTAAFCGLKVADVRWLRLRPGWRSTVAASLIVALLHVNVIERAQGGEAALAPGQLGVFLFVGSTLLDTESLGKALKRFIRMSRQMIVARRPIHVHLDPYLRVLEAAFEPVPLRFGPRSIPTRAPPA